MSTAFIHDLDEFGYRLVDGSILVPCRNAHLLNHSCDANVLDFELDFGVAVRNIGKNEEIFCDYRTFIYDPPWTLKCKCASASCVTEVSSKRPIDVSAALSWRSKVRSALRSVLNRPGFAGGQLV